MVGEGPSGPFAQGCSALARVWLRLPTSLIGRFASVTAFRTGGVMQLRTITIVGAGMMGSAMCTPAHDNGHIVRLVGTPLDREIIASVKQSRFHPTLQRHLPTGVQAYQIEELEQALDGAELVIGGVSSFGVDWFSEQVLPLIPTHLPVLLVTKGLAAESDGGAHPFPSLHAEKSRSGETAFPQCSWWTMYQL